jgi:catechol 2,3-dioxygenase-like lactoylglutathione lyase family enzyme
MATMSPTQPAEPRVRPLRRAAIMVRDLDRALALYRDVLGMAVWRRGAAGADNPDFFRMLGVAPGQGRWVILQAEGSEVGMVGLFEVSGPAPPPLARPDHGAIAVGEVALVFLARDLPALHRRIAALGLTVIGPPVPFTPPGGPTALEMTFRDFDGALVNLIESR